MRSSANLLPVYLRREPTTDRLTTASYQGRRRPYDVVAYRADVCYDPEYATNGRTWFAPGAQIGRWPWDRTRKPRPGRKTITLNCFNWRVIWLSDIVEEVS